MLELAKQNGTKILYSSTSEVYGDPEISPQPETYRGNVNTGDQEFVMMNQKD
jgi:UDP-glucuronate decarboxylase